MSDKITEQKILLSLSDVNLPLENGDFSGKNIVEAKAVSGIAIKDGNVIFTIEISPSISAHADALRTTAEQAVHAIDGVLSVTAIVTAHREAGTQPSPHAHAGHSHGYSHDHAGAQTGVEQMASPATHIVAVASGKGGVGKSTTAINLALGFAALGKKTGILDADIYGPSLPRLLGINQRPETKDKKLVPIDAWGLKAMSIGFLVEEDSPTIWRGPMVMSALQQMLTDVAWGELDILVIDMPPGTGDAQLTLSQRAALAGAVIVSTPQDLALIDARKGLNMFRRVDVPVLGIIENMSYFLCPDCGGRADIFGTGGAEAEAARMGVPFLGHVPLEMEIRKTSDEGTPVVASAPDGPHALIYKQIAASVTSQLDTQSDGMPAIIME